jgi:hypothetical protein
MRIKSPKDFWAGLMFIGFGVFFMVWAITHYQMGTAVRMGPAYFPTMLGGLLAFLGLLVLIEAFAMEGPKVPRFAMRPLILISCAMDLQSLVFAPANDLPYALFLPAFANVSQGDMVTVSVSPSKRLPNLGYFRTATLPDGTILKDCGFAAFRDGIAKGKTGCEENTR